MPTTMKLIAKSVLNNSTTTNVGFTSIPGTYTDLVVLGSCRGTFNTDAAAITMYLNDNNTNGSFRTLFGTGSSAGSASISGYMDMAVIPAALTTSNTFGSFEMVIPNYAGSSNKSISCSSVRENNATGSSIDLFAILWASTSAITKIDLTINAGNYVSGSSFFLYGITKA